jgi:TatD DNase family protein
MQLVDTHAHINFEQYDKDRLEVMRRAYESGVSKIIHSCCTVAEIPRLMELSEEYDGRGKPDLYMAVGVHPTEIFSWNEDSSMVDLENFIIQEIEEEKCSRRRIKIKAVGETGLDYYHIQSHEDRKLQASIFKKHIEIAKRYSLPLIVHTRDAQDDTLKIIEEEFKADDKSDNGVIHCYTGDLDFALACIKRGFYISWSGIITFKNSADLRTVAIQIPLERTLIETDCPFLAPQAQRGKRNEPSFVNYVADTLSECLGIGREDLARITTKNAENLFKI